MRHQPGEPRDDDLTGRDTAQALRERLQALRRDGTPISLVGTGSPAALAVRLAWLGLGPDALDIRNVLAPADPGADPGFADVPRLPCDADTVRKRCPGHAFLVLPCAGFGSVRERLIRECGLEPQRNLSLAPLPPPPQPQAVPQAARQALAALDPALPERIGLGPGPRVEEFAQDRMLRRLLRDWKARGVAHPAVSCDIRLLNAFIQAAIDAGFSRAGYVDAARRTPFNAFSLGIGLPVAPDGLGAAGIDALALLAAPADTRAALDAAREAGRLPDGLLVADLDAAPLAEETAGRMAEDIARRIDALQIDVLYVGEFVYYNFCKQSQALRRRGWRTAVLLQQAASMAGKDAFFDGVYCTYNSLRILFEVLRRVRVPIVHVQAWLGCPQLPPVVLAAADRSRCVVEFNDMPELVGWETVAELFGPDMAELERRNFDLVMGRAHGLVYNLRPDRARELTACHAAGAKPHLAFHSYPAREFAAPAEAAPPPDAGRPPRLAFIGSVAPSHLPVRGFGDVQMLHLARELLAQGLGFEILLVPAQSRNQAGYADYRHLEALEPRFAFRDGLEQPALSPVLAGYDFGVMCYRLPADFRINRRHFQAMLPTKFFTFLEAGLPVIVSEELAYVAGIVRQHGLGLTVSQDDLPRLAALLAEVDTAAVRRNIAAYRERVWMERKIGRLEAFYQSLGREPA